MSSNINLAVNQLTGSIPGSFSNWPKLRYGVCTTGVGTPEFSDITNLAALLWL